MNNTHWIIQENLIKASLLEELKNVLHDLSISYETVKIIPFSDELPEIQERSGVSIFYGSTTLIMNAFRQDRFQKGIFYNPNHFCMPNYFEKWGEFMLNADSQILTFNEIVHGTFSEQSNAEKKKWFVRPIHDDKSFSGSVYDYDEIVRLESSLKDSNNPYLNEETLVAIAQPKEIAKEWRHFIVKGQVVSTSRYAENGKASKSNSDIPTDLIEFVEKRCQEYTPHVIFVMDTALANGEYKIVECNCFNDTGFYDHDIKKIIANVDEVIRQQN
jgi:hypothetical protein